MLTMHADYACDMIRICNIEAHGPRLEDEFSVLNTETVYTLPFEQTRSMHIRLLALFGTNSLLMSRMNCILKCLCHVPLAFFHRRSSNISSFQASWAIACGALCSHSRWMIYCTMSSSNVFLNGGFASRLMVRSGCHRRL